MTWPRIKNEVLDEKFSDMNEMMQGMAKGTVKQLTEVAMSSAWESALALIPGIEKSPVSETLEDLLAEVIRHTDAVREKVVEL